MIINLLQNKNNTVRSNTCKIISYEYLMHFLSLLIKNQKYKFGQTKKFVGSILN